MKATRHLNKLQDRGSILVVVLWIVFGLVAVTLYFANSMSFELRASDNRTAGIEAEQAIEAARRYITCVLSNVNQRGVMPDPQSYKSEAVEVGNAKFWILGRTNTETANLASVTSPAFGLISESSKLNLNAVFVTTNLALLPRMTLDLANNIVSWKSSTSNNTSGGVDSSAYMMLQPPYLCKGAPFETVEELRLVYNMNLDLLYGEDANLNGILDANENDGDVLAPSDNMDGRLDPGLFESLTVYTHEPTTFTNSQGTSQARINVTTTTARTLLLTLFTSIFGQDRAQQILGSAGPGPYSSPLFLYAAGGMTPAEFAQIETNIMGPTVVGLVNINTASAAVLACLPGMDINKATQVVNFRQSNQGNTDYQNSICWVSQVLDAATAIQIGPYITSRTYQFMADVVAVGHYDRGYRRVRFVFDTSQGTPVIVYRQDLSHLGWALGKTGLKNNNKTGRTNLATR